MRRSIENEELQTLRGWKYCDEICIVGKAALTAIGRADGWGRQVRGSGDEGKRW